MKGAGYLVSSVSVLLLAVSPLKTAMEDPWLMFCLAGGVLLSILGMALRYLSHRHEKKEKERLDSKIDHTRRQVDDGADIGRGAPATG